MSLVYRAWPGPSGVKHVVSYCIVDRLEGQAGGSANLTSLEH